MTPAGSIAESMIRYINESQGYSQETVFLSVLYPVMCPLLFTVLGIMSQVCCLLAFSFVYPDVTFKNISCSKFQNQ